MRSWGNWGVWNQIATGTYLLGSVQISPECSMFLIVFWGVHIHIHSWEMRVSHTEGVTIAICRSVWMKHWRNTEERERSYQMISWSGIDPIVDRSSMVAHKIPRLPRTIDETILLLHSLFILFFWWLEQYRCNPCIPNPLARSLASILVVHHSSF